ncbi:MAG: L-serine ammonia-lyase, iron-sulfur-dependent subunit beta [Acidaminococcales bacterium]|jgi:L-serine dehydratase|nr:L-serine ammonia-lyase, iron-sulfur-dependent subunit beta [Acidaminococcales bacterium]
MNLFDIIGPIMIGPSSSHTAGAVRLGLLARQILGEEPVKAVIDLYGSFARTCKGHGTDAALLAGLLGWRPDDGRIPRALDEAEKSGLDYSFNLAETGEFVHPNTVLFHLTGAGGRYGRIGGVSLGGGRISVNNIDGFPVELSGELNALLTMHEDRAGIVSAVSSILAEMRINIAGMRVFRRQKGGLAAMIIETDQPAGQKVRPIIAAIPGINSVRLINSIL